MASSRRYNEVVQRVRGVGKSNRAAAAQTNNKGEFQFRRTFPAHYYLRTTKTHDADAPRIDLHAGDNITNVRIVMQQPCLIASEEL
jgi:hypothetical protein